MNSFLDYKQMFSNAPFGMMVISIEGDILDVNEAFCRTLGYEADELKNKNYKSLISCKECSRNSFNFLKFKNEEKDLSKVRFIKKDDKIIEVFYKKALVEKNVKKPSTYIIQILEIINEVQVEEVLNQESGLLDALMDSFPSEIFIKNKESQIVKVNKAFLQNKNQSSIDTVIGKTDFDYYNKAHAHKAYNDEQRIIRTGKPILNIEEKECYPDGKNVLYQYLQNASSQ